MSNFSNPKRSIRGLYADVDKSSGLELGVVPGFSRYPSTSIVTSDRSPAGIAFVRRSTQGGYVVGSSSNADGNVVQDGGEGDDVLLARIGQSGNMYIEGNLEVKGGIYYAGGYYAGETIDGEDGRKVVDGAWEKGGISNGTLVLNKKYDRVGINTTNPQYALHVSDGTICATSFRGKIAFSDVTHVPGSSADTAGLVRLTDRTDLRDGSIAASANALRKVRDAVGQKVSRNGDVIRGDLHVRYDGAPRLTINTSADVLSPSTSARLGVNTDLPMFSLDVAGDINFTGRLLRDGRVQELRKTWELSSDEKSTYFGGAVGIGRLGNPDEAALDVEGDIRGSGDIMATGEVVTRSLVIVDPELEHGNQRGDDRYRMTRDVVPVDGGGTGSATHSTGGIMVGDGARPLHSAPELHWDRDTHRLGVRTASPSHALHVDGNALARNLLSGRIILSTAVATEPRVDDVYPMSTSLGGRGDGFGDSNNIDYSSGDGQVCDWSASESNLARDVELGQFLPGAMRWRRERVDVGGDGDGGDDDNDVDGGNILDVDGSFRVSGQVEWYAGRDVDERKTSDVGGVVSSPDASISRPARASLAINTDGVERVRVASDGRVGIKTPDPFYDLDVHGSVAYTSAHELSDRRTKSNIETLDRGLERVLAMRGVSFERDRDSAADRGDGGGVMTRKSVGLVAQEVADVLPEVVGINEQTGMYSVSYGNVVAVLVQAVKEMDAKFEAGLRDVSRRLDEIDDCLRGDR